MNPYNPANNPQAGGTSYVAHLNDDTVSRQRRRVRGEEEGEALLVERDYDDDKVSLFTFPIAQLLLLRS